MNMLQSVALRYRTSLKAPASAQSDAERVNKATVAAFIRNMETLGFGFTVTAVQSFLTADAGSFKTWAVDVLKTVRESKGDNYNYNPMYPNFPEQVADATDEELFLNAILHYFGDAIGLRILPEYEKEQRFPLTETPNLVVLNVINDTDFMDILANLLNSRVSWSAADVEAVNHLVAHCGTDTTVSVVGSTDIPNKENLAHLAGIVRGDKVITAALFQQVRTATDVLRVAAVYSDAHPALNEFFRFGKITRNERKTFVRSLENLGSPVEEYLKNRDLWKRFNRRLHVNEIGNESIREVFQAVHSNIRPVTWGTQVEAAFSAQDMKTVVDLLVERPGIFTRRLYQVLSCSSYDEQEYAVTRFWEVAFKADTPVLWQAYAHFKTLSEHPNLEESLVFVKGTPVVYPKTAARPLNTLIVDEVLSALIDGIEQQYATRPSLGSVRYVHQEGFNPTVPFGLRSFNSAFKTLGRGSTLRFNTDRTLRFFIHWRDEVDSRVDLDLSAMMLAEDFTSLGEIAYYNLREAGCVHSGDITSAPDGASEFIDVDIRKLRAKIPNVRYVLMTVNSFTHQKFSDLTETLAGFMTREEPMSGEVYEPATVENAFTVNNPTTMVAPILFDLINGEAVWLDLATSGVKVVNNAHTNSGRIHQMLNTYNNMYKVTVDDVIKANIAARGHNVASDFTGEVETQIRLTNDDTNTIHFDEILSQWL